MTPISRASIHEEPRGAVAIARHYIRDLIYGANDGTDHELRRGCRGVGRGAG
jgi:hypothetical protein